MWQSWCLVVIAGITAPGLASSAGTACRKVLHADRQGRTCRSASSTAFRDARLHHIAPTLPCTVEAPADPGYIQRYGKCCKSHRSHYHLRKPVRTLGARTLGDGAPCHSHSTSTRRRSLSPQCKSAGKMGTCTTRACIPARQFSGAEACGRVRIRL